MQDNELGYSLKLSIENSVRTSKPEILLFMFLELSLVVFGILKTCVPELWQHNVCFEK